MAEKADHGAPKGKGEHKEETEKKAEGGKGDHGSKGADKKTDDTMACRSCGQHRPLTIPQCPACGAGIIPEYHIELTLSTGATGHEILVETSKSGEDVSLSYWLIIDGQNLGSQPRTTNDKGWETVPLSLCNKARRVDATLVGSRTRVKKPLYIPADHPKDSFPDFKPEEGVSGLLRRYKQWKQNPHGGES